MKIYLDLDDVGNELCRYLFETYNKEHDDEFLWLDSETFMLAENEGLKVGNEFFEEVLHRKGTFYHLNPAPGYVSLVADLIEDGHDVRILTQPKWSSTYCLEEKMEWVRTHLPFFDLRNLMMTGLKEEVAKEGRILLDDNPNHLRRWEENGGIGVAYNKIKYSDAWDGYKVESFEGFNDLVNELKTK